MLTIDQDGAVKEQMVEKGNYAFSLRLHVYHGKQWFTLGKWKKWAQDGKYHPDKTIAFNVDEFRDVALPALAAFFDKQLV